MPIFRLLRKTWTLANLWQLTITLRIKKKLVSVKGLGLHISTATQLPVCDHLEKMVSGVK